MLGVETFLEVVHATPLVAMDLLVVSEDNQVLLGMRNNRPAQGFWFAPGGRIRKNESMQCALTRVAAQELGLQLADLPAAVALGAFEHFYPDSFAGDVGVSTHYVAMGNLIRLSASTVLRMADTQHAELRWWPLAQARASDSVHPYTKDYLDTLMHR